MRSCWKGHTILMAGNNNGDYFRMHERRCDDVESRTTPQKLSNAMIDYRSSGSSTLSPE